MTIIQHNTTATAEAPRTILSLSATLDAVMLRIDAAGLKPIQILSVSLSPRVWEDGLQAPVDVKVQLDSLSGFDELIAAFGKHTRDDSDEWLNAYAPMRDGAVVNITAPVTA